MPFHCPVSGAICARRATLLLSFRSPPTLANVHRMDRAEISRLLAGHAEDLKAYGVLARSVFGSVARGQARPDSDIDLLVEFGRPIGLFRFVGLQQLLEGILGRRVDLVPRDSIRRALRDVILGE